MSSWFYFTTIAILSIICFILILIKDHVLILQADIMRSMQPSSVSTLDYILRPNITFENSSFIDGSSVFNSTAKEKKDKILYNLTTKQSQIEYKENKIQKKKIIQFWNKWWNTDWSGRFGNYSALNKGGCPTCSCEFTFNKSRIHDADAVVFTSLSFSEARRIHHAPSQVWVWVDVEAPIETPALRAYGVLKKQNLDTQVNWTMTYHRNADIAAFSGYFLAINQTTRPIRPHLMSSFPETMEKYQKVRERNITLEEVMGPDWRGFVDRPRLVSWMSSHCPTRSKREEYIKELQTYADVDTFGKCGKKTCEPKSPRGAWCWEKVMRPNYLFYFSMENNLCQDYISEKLYNSLVHGLVPIVWGGANYSEFLPPGSFIDARMFHPKDLAQLLLKLKNDPVSYGMYHVWRKFWTPQVLGSMCELCDKLHKHNIPTHYKDIEKFRKENGQCIELSKGIFKNGSWSKNNRSDNTTIMINKFRPISLQGKVKLFGLASVLLCVICVIYAIWIRQ